MGEGVWWVARAIVQPEDKRGQGIGSEMFRMLKEELLNVEHGSIKLIVAPGGYNIDSEKQKRFYTKNGFVKSNDFFELVLSFKK